MGAGASKTSPNSKSAYSVQRSKRESITNLHPEQTYRWEPLSVAVEKELVVMKHSPFNSPSPMWTTSRYLCCLLSAVNNKEEAGTQLPNKDTIPKKKKKKCRKEQQNYQETTLPKNVIKEYMKSLFHHELKNIHMKPSALRRKKAKQTFKISRVKWQDNREKWI